MTSDRLLLGRRLRHARRREPGEGHVHRRHRLRGRGSARTGISPPEGNAHEAEFSHDNTYFLGADEDFNPYRADKFFVDDQSSGRRSRSVAERRRPSLPDQTLSGKVVYGGYGCPAGSDRAPQAADYTDAELGLQPGTRRSSCCSAARRATRAADYNGNGDLTDDACFPGEKAAKAFDAGWDAIVLVEPPLRQSTTRPACRSAARARSSRQADGDDLHHACGVPRAVRDDADVRRCRTTRRRRAGDRRRSASSACGPPRSSTAGAT